MITTIVIVAVAFIGLHLLMRLCGHGYRSH